MVVKFLADYDYKTRNWKTGDIKNIDRGLAGDLISQGIAKAVTDNCGCGQ